MREKFIVTEGQKFNRLTVMQEILVEIGSARKVKVKCDCGNITDVFLQNLKRNHTKSCGCLNSESVRTRATTHGQCLTKVYKAWQCMKARCYNTSTEFYHLYGGRGITVCDRWLESFENFLEDIGPPPVDDQKWSLERLNPNLGYFKTNVEWGTSEKQNRNRGIFKNNTSGTTGVGKRERAGLYRYVAFWRELNGKEKFKSFAVKKYGETQAYLLACDYRKDQIARINSEGGNYSEYHGV